MCSTDGVKVRIASYNVEFSRSATPEQIGEMLRPHDFDVVGLCESPAGDWTERVAHAAGLEHWFAGEVSSANHKDKYKAILSRTPLGDTDEHRLGSGSGWNPASVVSATTCVGGLAITFSSLHICASGSSDGHAFELATRILPTLGPGPVVAVGDYNNRLEDDAMLTLDRAGMRSTWRDLDLDLTGAFTWNAFAPDNSRAGVIDHILYSRASSGQVRAGGIIEMAQPLSDHKPIWAEIVFPVG
ncbi:MAG: endonuclease/exonuclease/phosphatase family protein [Lentisphaerae bacterium]|jgi:maltose 6'-phosphate phosphatase|nr:endonuclease/exonuclease/phosphatase family protein [Lentisphaerota bacterium]MBT4818023.1 endonuclease/exonuclease/phosphatase family protein [Lentisphaerota bacterium]MBT5605876.1 endonuclease/exonuclease/phosphatase family protein [Lentisphaerota bacterium]MBT7055268.1 endonuclease/exonuclease/phosphatase family protein [Lentisphaerota bacterium]MBT7848492.1 endonuclease/exonuclease/phosphatase family protein [Lentisphaerota bacterium]